MAETLKCERKGKTLTCTTITVGGKRKGQHKSKGVFFIVLTSVLLFLFVSGVFELAMGFFPNTLQLVLITGGIVVLLAWLKVIPVSEVLEAFGAD